MVVRGVNNSIAMLLLFLCLSLSNIGLTFWKYQGIEDNNKAIKTPICIDSIINFKYFIIILLKYILIMEKRSTLKYLKLDDLKLDLKNPRFGEL